MADDYSADSSKPGYLAVGNSVTGNFEVPTDRDWFAVDLVAGTTYVFTATSPVYTLNVIDGAGNRVSDVPDYVGGTSVLFTATSTGTYYLEAGAVDNHAGSVITGSTGQYTISARVATGVIDDHPVPVVMPVGTLVTGTIDALADSDSFLVQLQAGHSYTFTGSEHYSSGYEYQYQSPWHLERLDGDTATWIYLDSSHVLTPTSDGLYRVTFQTYYLRSLQSYTLKVTDLATDDYPAQASTPNAADGKVLTGLIQSSGDVDGFKISFAAGQTLAFRVSGLAQYGFNALTADQIVLGVDGVPAGYQVHNVQGDIDFVSVTATQAGTVDLGVTSTVKGGYQLLVINRTGDDTGPVLVSGQDATLGLTDALHLQFSEPVGQVANAASQPALTLLDASGKAIDGFSAHWTGDGPWHGSELVITSNTTWQPGQNYTLLFGDSTFVDMAGNSSTLSAVHFSTTALAGTASTGNDFLRASHTGARIDGGAGLDTVFYDGTADGMTVRAQADGSFTVGAPGAQTDTLVGIERVLIGGQKDALALDVGANDIGGEVYRLYQAAFGRTPDKAGLGYWLSAMQHGASLRDVANGFYRSSEYQQLYNSFTHSTFANQLYHNVLHRDADIAGLDYWIGQLERGMLPTDVLVAFSQSAENQAGVAAIIGNGFTYTPYST